MSLLTTHGSMQGFGINGGATVSRTRYSTENIWTANIKMPHMHPKVITASDQANSNGDIAAAEGGKERPGRD